MAFDSGTNYRAADVVSVAKLGYSMVYECKASANSAFCSMPGFEPDTGLYVDQAWTALGSCMGGIPPTSSPQYSSPVNAVGCPEEFSSGEDYEEGDRIARNGLIYQCKSGPASRHCSQDGFEPGISLESGMQSAEHWREAWSITGYCRGTIAPTSSPDFVVLPDMGGCPGNWSPQPYETGDRVSSKTFVFECNAWPYSMHCGQVGYEPLMDPATPGAWRDAWTIVGHCDGTIEPTGAPNFAPTNSVGACPEQWVAGSDTKYEEGDLVSVITSTTPLRTAAFKCREWPLSGFCGQFSPTSNGGNQGWIHVGSCDGTFAPTSAPAPYAARCQYNKCENDASGEEQCTLVDVDPWNSRTNYVEDDVVRLGIARFRCREWPFFLWCRQFEYSPTLASDGIWNEAWSVDEQCPRVSIVTTEVTFPYELSLDNLVVPDDPIERETLVDDLTGVITSFAIDGLTSEQTLESVAIRALRGVPVGRQRLLQVTTGGPDVEAEVIVTDRCEANCGSEEEIASELAAGVTAVLEDENVVTETFQNTGNNALSTVSVNEAIVGEIAVQTTIVNDPPSKSPTSSPSTTPTKSPSTSPSTSPTSSPSQDPLSPSRLLRKLESADDNQDDEYDDNQIESNRTGSVAASLEYFNTRTSTEIENIFKEDFILPIYYANLDQSVDRRVHMENMLSELATMGHLIDPVRISAKNMDDVQHLLEEGRFIPNGIDIVPTDDEESWLKHQRKQYPTIEVAVLLSHLYTILQAYQDGQEIALVLEDDAVLKNDFFSHWKELTKMAPSDWKILQWATSNDAVLEQNKLYENDPWIAWQPEFYSANGYMITREGMEELLSHSLKQTESGVIYWDIDEPELIVADEVVYYLAGGAYTSTFPWISTSGQDSTLGESHKIFKTDDIKYEAKEEGLKRQENILILSSCTLSDEKEIIEEAKRLETDVENFSRWNSNFRWVVSAMIVDQRLVPIFEEKISSFENLSVEIRSHGGSKFGFVADLIGEIEQFDYVLLKDNDIRLSGFPWNTFMERKGNSVVSGVLRQSVEEALARNLGKPKHESYEFNEGQMWKYFGVPEYTSLSPIPTMFIEHGFALLEAKFAEWFFTQMVDTQFLSQRSDGGVDRMWCGAAKTFSPNSPPCTLVPVVVLHDNVQTLPVSNGFQMFDQMESTHLNETQLLGDWLDEMTGWEHFIGNDSDLKTVLERCRAILYSGRHTTSNILQCASLVVEEKKELPGDIYACGWDAIALNIFPDFTYRGLWSTSGKSYTEKDIIVVDLHSPCVPTGDWQLSFDHMAEIFPGKILYVNGESVGNVDDYPEMDPNKRSFQIGPFPDSSQSTQVYLAAMTLFVIEADKWSWIFDPNARQINTGKHQAIAYFVSNCIPYRQNAAKELSNIAVVHHGSGCHVESENTKQMEMEHHHWSSNWKLFRDYKYCLVMENTADQSGYITEKIVMAFLGGCIPIYYGTQEVFDIFNPESFIFYDINNPEPALAKMRLFEEDPESYRQAFKEPILKDGSVTIEKFLSLSDEFPGNSGLKSRIRKTMGLGE